VDFNGFFYKKACGLACVIAEWQGGRPPAGGA